MRVAVILTGAIVMIPFGTGIVWREPLEPSLVVFMQSRLIVIDEYRGGNMHGVYQAQPLADATVLYRLLDVVGEIHEAHPLGNLHG
jgi:hypothetical protein